LQPARSSTIQLCGTIAVELDGQRIDRRLPGRQGRLLLAYLVLNRRRTASRDELCEALWPQGAPASASAALTVLLSRLRAAIGPGRLRGRGALQLVLPEPARVDVEQAITGLHEAQSALAAGEWQRAWICGLRALLIAERPLLAEHDAPWIDDWRRRLDVVLDDATQAYATACLERGGAELAAAARAARRLVERSPLRESGYRLLIETLSRQGNVAEAIRMYDRARTTLRDELGIAPGPTLQEAHARLLG
jgi:SARP family transcriptional regulator, regulator of embCAB operon